ncbi:hypothetical protein Tco_0741783 [Tanacetum coccineum]
MKGNEIEKYTTCFNELVGIVPHMVATEEQRVDHYIWGLNSSVKGNVTSSNPTTLQAAVSMAHRLTVAPNNNRNNNNRKVSNQRVPARGRVHVIGADEVVQNPTIVTEFKPLLNQKPEGLVETYAIEFVNGHLYEASEILARAEIDCYAKIVRIPLVDGGTLVVQGNKSRKDLKIISAIKMRRYLKKDYVAFLAHMVDIGAKVKDIKDIIVVRNHPEVFSKDLLGLPPTQQVEFQIDLVPGAAPVAKALSRLVTLEMPELSE